MIITLCRRGLLKIYASFCELNISFCKTLTFRFADYKCVRIVRAHFCFTVTNHLHHAAFTTRR